MKLGRAGGGGEELHEQRIDELPCGCIAHALAPAQIILFWAPDFFFGFGACFVHFVKKKNSV